MEKFSCQSCGVELPKVDGHLEFCAGCLAPFEELGVERGPMNQFMDGGCPGHEVCGQCVGSVEKDFTVEDLSAFHGRQIR